MKFGDKKIVLFVTEDDKFSTNRIVDLECFSLNQLKEAKKRFISIAGKLKFNKKEAKEVIDGFDVSNKNFNNSCIAVGLDGKRKSIYLERFPQ